MRILNGIEAGPAPFDYCQSFRVLVVDDFRPMADHLAGLVSGKGYNVRVAYDGAEALRAAEQFLPNALVSDIHMPGLSGFDLAQAFAERFPKCHVVLITVDSAIAEYHGREYTILHKFEAPEALPEFLAACQIGE